MEKVNIEWLKRQAKKLKKEKAITHTEALELIAKEQGHSSWKQLMLWYNETKHIPKIRQPFDGHPS